MSETDARPANPNAFTNRSNAELREVIRERAPAIIKETIPEPDMTLREFVPEFVAELDAQGDLSGRRMNNATRDLLKNPDLLSELEAYLGPNRRVGYVGYGDRAIALSVEDENGKRRVLRITNADEGALRTERDVLKPLDERRIGNLRVQINEPVVDLQTLASREFNVITPSEANQLRGELDVDVARTGIVVADSHNGNYAFKEDGTFAIADHGAVQSIDEQRAILESLPEGRDRDNKLRQFNELIERASPPAAPEVVPEHAVPKQQVRPQEMAPRSTLPELTPQERLAAWDISDQIHTQDKFSWRETPDKKIQYTFSGDNLPDVQESLKAAGIESDIKGRGLSIRPESMDQFHKLRMAGEMTDVAEGPRPAEYRRTQAPAPEPAHTQAAPVKTTTEEPIVRRPAIDNNSWGLRRQAAALPDVDLPTPLPERISPTIERPHVGGSRMGKIVGVGGAAVGVALVGGTIAYESQTANLDVGQERGEMAGFTARQMAKGLVLDTGLRDLSKGHFGDAALAAGSVPLGIDLKGVVAQRSVEDAAREVPVDRVASVQKAIAEGAKSKDVDPEHVSDPQLKFLFQLHALRAAGATRVNVVDGLDGTRLNGNGLPRGDIANAVQSHGGMLTVSSRYIDTFRSGNYQKGLGLQPFTDGRIYDADIDAMIDKATREYIAKGGSEIAIREATDLDFRALQRFTKLYETVPDANTPGYKHHSVEAVNGNVQLIEFRDLVQSGGINTPEGRARGIELSNQYYKEWDYDNEAALKFASRSYSRTDFTIARPETLVAAGMGPVFGGLSGRPEDIAADMDKINKTLNTEVGDGKTIRSRINPGSDWSAGAADIYTALPPEMQRQASAESARLQDQARVAALSAAMTAPAAEPVAPVAPAAAPQEPAQEDIVVTASVPRKELKARGTEVKDPIADKFRDAGVFAALDADGDGKLLLGEVIQAARAAGIRDANGGTVDSTDVNSGLAVNLIQRMRDGSALG